MKGDVCVACGESLDADELGRPLSYLSDRQGRTLCFACVADAITDMAIEKQQRERHFAELKKNVPFLNDSPFADEREECGETRG